MIKEASKWTSLHLTTDAPDPARTWCGILRLLLGRVGDVGVLGVEDVERCTCVGCLGERALSGDGSIAKQASARLIQLAKCPPPGWVTGRTDNPPPGLEWAVRCPSCASRDTVVTFGIAGIGSTCISGYFVCETCGFLAKREMEVVS